MTKKTAVEIAQRNHLISLIRKINRELQGSEDDELREYVREVLANHPVNVALDCMLEIEKQLPALKALRQTRRSD